MSGILWGGAMLIEEVGEVQISGGTAAHFVFTFQGIDAFAGWQFSSSGQLNRREGSQSIAVLQEWWTNNPESAVGADYEIRAIQVSGTTPTGPTLAVWHNLAVARQWSLTRSTIGTSTCSLSISIRDVATQTIQDTATYNISAIKEN